MELFEAPAILPGDRARDWIVPCPMGDRLLCLPLMMNIQFPSILTTIAEHKGGELDIRPLDPPNVAMPDSIS
jgi:hypothetical protein